MKTGVGNYVTVYIELNFAAEGGVNGVVVLMAMDVFEDDGDGNGSAKVANETKDVGMLDSVAGFGEGSGDSRDAGFAIAIYWNGTGGYVVKFADCCNKGQGTIDSRQVGMIGVCC